MSLPILVSRSEINDQRWNDLIAKSEQSVFYAYSWYLDVVCDSWKAIVWPSVEDYRIVMPLPVKRKRTFEVIQQPLFCQYLGLFSSEKVSEQQVDSFIKKIYSSFFYISSYHFNPDNSEILKAPLRQFPEHTVKVNCTYWLGLHLSHAQILANYTSDRHVNLKRGEKQQWKINKSEDIDPLIKLFQENHASQISGGVADKAYKILSNLFKILKAQNAVELYYSEKQDQIHAGILIVKKDNRVIFLFNAADLAGRNGNARTVLLDHYFRTQAESQLVFDFESPEIKSISHFYKSFGAKEIPYLTIRKNGLPFPLNYMQDWRVRRLISTIEARSEDF